jgi:hypothetical protein
MALTPGTRLGAHEILAPLGAGGMGEVYRARDSALGREVAIKALPPEFAADAERVSRFEREAQALAALQHPHIAGIHQLLEHDGARYLVLELVPGETLAARIARGPLPLDEALPLAREIAEALEAAHDRGIVHRDLKPANVMVTPDGHAKVLDFGLAKLLDATPEAPSGALATSPTMTSPAHLRGATSRGVILGTAAYMSPEQARGRPVDRRADVWAFGAVLFEMLTGRTAFPGETVSDTISAVLSAEPDWHALPAATPAAVHRLLRRCLVKDARQRLPHIGIARLEVDERAGTEAMSSSPRRARGWLWPAVAALAVVAAAAVAIWPRQAPPGDRDDVIRFEVGPPEGTTRLGHTSGGRGTNTPAPHYAVSPDGRTLVFAAARPSGAITLWLRDLAMVSSRELPGTDDASFPFWSPDGRHVAYFASGHLMRVPIAGGRTVGVAPAAAGEGGTWGPDGTIVFAPTQEGGLWRVPSSGGNAQPITTPPDGTADRWPQFVDGGRRLLYLSARTGGRGMARLLDLASGTSVDVLETPTRVMAASGWLVFHDSGRLMAQPFDEATGRLSGAATALVESVGASPANRRAGFHLSPGMLVHRRAAPASSSGSRTPTCCSTSVRRAT